MAAEAAAVAGKLAEARDTGILDLSNCKLMQIPPSVYIFIEKTTVTKCDLSNNEIKSLPAQLFQNIKDVEELNLANNNLGTIPDDISALKKLRTLNITHNNLTMLPGCLYHLDSLVELRLQDNQIQVLDTEMLRYMRSLQLLHLEENSLDEETMDALREFEEEHEDVFIRLG